MPNFDGGHYFLTALIPVRTEPVEDARSTGSVTSHSHALREVLARTPTAQQTWATENLGLNSPFARDARTHFARLVVLDDVAYNGREQRDPIIASLTNQDPFRAAPVDHLTYPYLIFVCDFDAKDGSDAELEGYLRGLWSVMDVEWRAILQHCQGFERVDGPDGFARLIRDCQVETTMPFNDYYVPFPALPAMPLLPLLAPSGIAALAFLVPGIIAMFGGGWFWAWLSLAGLAALPVALFLAYRQVIAKGQEPLPTGARTDLVGVTKALYLQQHFTRFAIDMQGRDAASLHAGFGEFLRTHRPEDPLAPTQARGTVRS